MHTEVLKTHIPPKGMVPRREGITGRTIRDFNLVFLIFYMKIIFMSRN